MGEEEMHLIGLLEEAVHRVYAEDRPLLQFEDGNRKGLEQAFVFRVGIYLHELLKGTAYEALDLDSEYNKNHGDTKLTDRFPDGIRPDLIVHQRDTHEQNKMAVEFKGWWNNDIENDWQKLEDLTSPHGVFHYLEGVSVIIGKSRPEYNYFSNGERTEL